MTPVLRSERLVLEPYIPGDEEDFVALFQDARVTRWIGDGPSTEAADRALFGRIFPNVYDRNAFDVWAVRENGALVGHAEIKPTGVSGGHELIYALAHAAWGRSLGTELASTIVAYGFDNLGLSEIHATVAAENTASLAVLAKLGFQHVRDRPNDDGHVTRVLTLWKQHP
ncbi:GNAT family N-acetyltransferase [Glycomyces buryatensis]|uniref:GNAT family N-acetyltransferase n=1 Tax=Glycomyces buryatensis TaxID=2570927 RepID=A0A4S8QQ60_9ACTN|nr:GNAT family N-acetyltransferase [Glycomyces buryatensis]THV43559.1 GNAT family N-acetyltransferase [Glycomyces buryatensis]